MVRQTIESFFKTVSKEMQSQSIIEVTKNQADAMLTPEHDTSFNTKLDDFIADYPNA